MEDVLLQIAEACAQDPALLEIVKHVASMDEEEKRLFETKVKVYFLNKTNEIDLQAYEFFRIVLDGDNARRILRLLKDESGTSSS